MHSVHMDSLSNSFETHEMNRMATYVPLRLLDELRGYAGLGKKERYGLLALIKSFLALIKSCYSPTFCPFMGE